MLIVYTSLRLHIVQYSCVQRNLLDELVCVEARPPADFTLEHFTRHHALQALERIRDSSAHLPQMK